MRVTDLKPITSHKSFYGKAVMIEKEDKTLLKSYQTIVAEYEHTTETMTIKGYYSATTARHINSFLDYFGFPSMSKKEIEQTKQLKR